MSAATITHEVADRFHGLRRAYLASQCAVAGLVTGVVWMLGWLLIAVADFRWELSLDVRQILMGTLTMLALAWLLFRVVVIFRQIGQRSFAGHLESTFADFGQRIRTVLDTVEGRVSGPDEMLSALGHQTMGRWETLSPEQLIPRRSLLFFGTAALMIAAICSFLFFGTGDWGTAMKRAVVANESYTQLSVTPGDSKFLEGRLVDVSLTLTGRIDRDVAIRHRVVSRNNRADATDEAEWIKSSLTRTDSTENGSSAGATKKSDKQAAPSSLTENRAVFDVPFGRATLPIEYQFMTSAGNSEIYRIDVQPLIKVDEVATTVTPPEYTQLDQRRFTSKRVTVLEGSTVLVTVQTNHPLESATLAVGSQKDSLQPITLPDVENRQRWQFALSGDTSSHWKFTGKGFDGTPMKPIVGRLGIRRDSGPKISFKSPGVRTEVHTLAEVPMTIQVADDFGLQECGIVFELGDEGEFVLTDWTADSVAHTTTTRLQLNEVLPLESFALTDRDFVSYYAYAIDNKATGPQRTESDVRYIDIRNLRQFYQVQDPDEPNAAPRGGGIRASLDEIIRRERFLVNRTRRLTRAAAADIDSQLGTIERMVESQSDLAGLVRSLTEFLVERGNDDVSALNQAEALMLQASDSLSAANFDLALTQQNDCLLALAEARQTLEITLSRRLTRQQRQQLARFNRKMRQKLRLERPQTDQQIADDLKKIANDQQRLSRNVAVLQKDVAQEEGQSNGEQTSPGVAASEPDVEGNAPIDSQSVESAESPDSETNSENASETIEDGENENEDESEGPMPLAKQLETTYDQQVELLERFQAVTGELQDRDDLSDLIHQRIESSVEQLDELTTSARQQEYDRIIRSGIDVADYVRELSLHLQARESSRPVERIGKLRDLTNQLAAFELALSRKTKQPANENDGLSEVVWNPMLMNADQIASRLQNRTQTIEDVLQIPVDIGDVETSEVNDVLKSLISETEFDTRLQEARTATMPISSASHASVSKQQSEAAYQRATEFAEVAERLDDLYQELVAPQLRQFQAMLNQARQLQGGSQGARSQQSPQKNQQMTDAERKVGMKELKEQLEEAGLKDLAKLLDAGEISDAEIRKMQEALTSKAGGGHANSTPSKNSVDSLRLEILLRKLREQIQQAILLEISADRNAPVPEEYRALVDGYFRSLAEGPTE